jgi:predicted DNA-binding antitoxin AbrB/MazE fold protein
MTQIDAVYQEGVFKPVEALALPENQRVRLIIQTVEPSDVRAWLAAVNRLQHEIVAQRGYFRDSTPDIASDRIRDE